MSDLKAHFITVDRPFKEGTVEVLEQAFSAADVKRATLSITALGVYEAELNGQKVGDLLFTPGYTYYPKDLHYQVYDVTGQLRENNLLRVYLGQGWYCGRFTCDNKTQIYGERPAVSWVLEVELADGPGRLFCSDDASVKAVRSPYEYAGFYDGEIYHASGGPDEVIQPIPYIGTLPDVLEQSVTGVKVQEEIPVRSVARAGNTTILDFGQNFAGFVEIDPAKMSGGTMKLRHGEILKPDGTLYTTNLRKAKAEIIYHKGTSEVKYRPRFTYMGFRYVELSGVDYVPGLVTAYAVYNEMERTGFFSCGNKLAEQLYRNQVWGQKSNYVEVPTDCPQRDERMGYTGDGHVFALTGAYNFDTESFWAKFLKDIRYSQMDNSEGYVDPTVPAQGPAGIGFLSMLGWGNCVTIVPEMLYWQYGTDKYLREQYESMKAFVDCEIRKMGDANLWMAPNLGDWLAMGKDIAFMAMHNGPVSNAFIVNDLRIMVWTAERLGKSEDAARYQTQLEKTRQAYLTAFVKEDGSMTDDYQGAYIMALKYVVPKGELWNKIFAKLVEKICAEGMQTGFFATEHLLPLLADNGEVKLAFDLLLQEECPGWMYQVKRGATTIWERWDALRPDGTVNETSTSGGDDNMVSFNHYAFGSVGEFYYRYILGIQPAEPGYAKVRIQPFVDERLESVSGSYRSRAGEIKVAWQIQNGDIRMDIQVPAMTEVILPDHSVHQVAQGQYHYLCQLGR